MFIRLAGRWFNTRLIFCIEKSKLSPDTDTILYPPGAHGGYLVHLPLEAVLDKVRQADEDKEDQLEALAEELEEEAGVVVDDADDADDAETKSAVKGTPQ